MKFILMIGMSLGLQYPAWSADERASDPANTIELTEANKDVMAQYLSPKGVSIDCDGSPGCINRNSIHGTIAKSGCDVEANIYQQDRTTKKRICEYLEGGIESDTGHGTSQ